MKLRQKCLLSHIKQVL